MDDRDKDDDLDDFFRDGFIDDDFDERFDKWFEQEENKPVKRRVNLMKKPKCDCGAAKCKTTHAFWCSTRNEK